jgi:hypothetical protein
LLNTFSKNPTEFLNKEILIFWILKKENPFKGEVNGQAQEACQKRFCIPDGAKVIRPTQNASLPALWLPDTLHGRAVS